MIHPPHISSVVPGPECPPAEPRSLSASTAWRWIARIIVVSLGILAGLVLSVIIAISMGLIQITC